MNAPFIVHMHHGYRLEFKLTDLGYKLFLIQGPKGKIIYRDGSGPTFEDELPPRYDSCYESPITDWSEYLPHNKQTLKR